MIDKIQRAESDPNMRRLRTALHAAALRRDKLAVARIKGAIRAMFARYGVGIGEISCSAE